MSDKFDFNELEEVLKRIRNEDNQETEPVPEAEPLEPPKTREEMQAESTEPTEETEAEAEESEKKALVSADIVKANFKTRLMPKVKDFFKMVFTRQLLISVGAIALIAALIFGGIKLYDYSKTAYLRPYIEKYGIEYPEGIREEFCDDYGKDQTVQGRIVIEDTSTDALVSGNKNGTAIVEKGSTVLQDQHLRAIALEKGNIESVYATSDGFVNATQLVTFKTLFDDEQYRVVAAYYTNINPDNDNGYVFPYSAYGNMTARSFKSYIDWVETKSDYLTNAELRYDDYYLSISAPAVKEIDARFVILCQRVRDGEEFEKITRTKQNKRVLKTQKYYDEQGEINPYRFAEKWYPEIFTSSDMTRTKKLTAKDFDL